MRRILVTTVSVCCAILSVCSCGKIKLAGITDIMGREIPMDFTSISVEGVMVVRFSENCRDGEAQIESDVNIIPHVEIYLDGSILKIKFSEDLKKQGNKWNSKQTKVTVPFKEGVVSVMLEDGADFFADTPVRGERFFADISSASRFTGGIEVTDLLDITLGSSSVMECGSLTVGEFADIKLDAVSKLKASGEINSCRFDLSGSSDVTGISESQKYSLSIKNCKGNLSDYSSATFRCEGEIACNLSNGSKIYYFGGGMNKSTCDQFSSVIALK